MRPLNVLYLHSHDTGRYVQPYGHAVATPNLQRLTEQGVLFRKAFCAGPTCSASRAALLTGQCPHSSGMIGLAHRGFSLHDCSQHIVHTLRKAGYFSALVGVQHVAKSADMIGYDLVAKLENNRADGVAAAARKLLAEAPKQPFFLDVGFVETHRSFPTPCLADDPRYCIPPAPLPDTPQTRRDVAAFKTSARILDQGMGSVLAALEESGLAGGTLVVCTTDHGIAFPGMKCNLTDHGIGVMLIVRGPGGFEGGKACDAMVSHIDIFPTVCDLLGIEPPGWLQGRSMMPLVRTEAEEINDEILAEVTYHAAHEPMRCVRTQRWKYIRRFDGRGRAVLPNCDDSLSKDVWVHAGWRDRRLAEESLYDLVFDPNETGNLAEDATCAPILEEMRARLRRWMERTDDPLLRGPVPAPPGAVVNDVDGLSPSEPTRRAL